MNKYSITSNEVKLFKHLDRLQLIQNKIPAPTQLHLSLTNKCNTNCIYCCFDERDRSLVLDFNLAKNAILSFKELGIKSIEITGGGEPTLYSKINELIEFIRSIDIKIGMNTNAISIQNVIHPEYLEWIRVTANIVDINPESMIAKWKDSIKRLIDKGCRITTCYIVPDKIGTEKLNKAIDLAEDLRIPMRITPDCIIPKEKIKKHIESINKLLGERKTKYCFSSEFNIILGNRPENICMIHMLKPYLFTDGWVYACPSSELSPENGKNMNHKFRICHASDILNYYKNQFEIKHFLCSYCKYTRQNEILYSLIMETTNNEFV